MPLGDPAQFIQSLELLSDPHSFQGYMNVPNPVDEISAVLAPRKDREPILLGIGNPFELYQDLLGPGLSLIRGLAVQRFVVWL
jgi:hypothetical protein